MNYEQVLLLSLLCLAGSVFSVFFRRQSWEGSSDRPKTRAYRLHMALGIALLVLGSCWLVLWALIQVYPLGFSIILLLMVIFALPAAAAAMAWLWHNQKKATHAGLREAQERV